MVRQEFPATTEWKLDNKFQHALEQGVSPLLFISDDEPRKIRRLQRDIKSIQAAGLRRTIHVLYPAPPMVNASSIKTTMATKLVNPKIFPISSILFFEHPGFITRVLGQTRKSVKRRFLVVSMDTGGGRHDFPIDVDRRTIQEGIASPTSELQSALEKHNLLVLISKDDERLPKLHTLRPAGSRVTSLKHPMRQAYASLLMTFASSDEANEYMEANRSSTRPIFMLSAFDMHRHPNIKTVTTSRHIKPKQY